MGNAAFVEQDIVFHLVKVEGGAIQGFVFACKVMKERRIQSGKTTHLGIIRHMGYGRKTEKILAIGTDFHKGQFKKRQGHRRILIGMKSVLEHCEVGAVAIADGRIESEGSHATVAEADDIHRASRTTQSRSFRTEGS